MSRPKQATTTQIGSDDTLREAAVASTIGDDHEPSKVASWHNGNPYATEPPSNSDGPTMPQDATIKKETTRPTPNVRKPRQAKAKPSHFALSESITLNSLVVAKHDFEKLRDLCLDSCDVGEVSIEDQDAVERFFTCLYSPETDPQPEADTTS
jgi:hypothetical protein